jgi:hypothetical protein
MSSIRGGVMSTCYSKTPERFTARAARRSCAASLVLAGGCLALLTALPGSPIAAGAATTGARDGVVVLADPGWDEPAATGTVADAR